MSDERPSPSFADPPAGAAPVVRPEPSPCAHLGCPRTGGFPSGLCERHLLDREVAFLTRRLGVAREALEFTARRADHPLTGTTCMCDPCVARRALAELGEP